ncbi:MAG: sensor histidine kinase [Acidobacteriota bacterium]
MAGPLSLRFAEAWRRCGPAAGRSDRDHRADDQRQGEGIDPAFLPHVFERLRQAEGSNKRAGLGLGLAIASHIVELHHGEIVASSDGLGYGAEFTITLPVHVRVEESVPA